MCINCKPILKAIDAYLAKTDNNFENELKNEGYIEPKKTVKNINEMEEKIVETLTTETDYILSEIQKAVDLRDFAKHMWPNIKLTDSFTKKLAKIFKIKFSEFIPEIAENYLNTLDEGLKITKVSKKTLYWIDSWSSELAKIMKLNNNKEIEHILKKGLDNGDGIMEFTRNIMNSGIRNEFYRARRTAITEVLTAHSVAQQEAFMQSPSIEEKMWRHTGIYIHKPRENHKDMDGHKIPKNACFELVGADGEFYYPMFPRDSNLPPAERIECHCLSQGIVNEKILGLTLEERKRLQQEAIDELDDKWFKEQEAKSKAMVGYIEE